MKVVITLFVFLLVPPLPASCSDTTFCLFPIKLDTKWGFIDSSGNLRIPFQFDSVRGFSEGLALAEIHNLWGYINKKGEFIITPRFLYADDFSCGLAKVNSTDPKYPTVFINRGGKIVISAKYQEVYSFHFGRAYARIDNRICFLDTTGKVVIKTKYQYGDQFYDGIALLWSANTAEYIDTSGTRIAFFNEMGHFSFSEGLASVLGNNKPYYINKAGKKIKIVSRSFYINKIGQPKIINTVDSLVYFPFYNGMAEVCIPGTGHKSGFMDTTGKIIIPVVYDLVSNFTGKYATVFKSGVGSIINKRGEIVADIAEYNKYFPKYVCRSYPNQ